MKKLFVLLLVCPLAVLSQISSLQTIFSTSGGIQFRGATENAFGDIYAVASLPGGLDDGDIVVVKWVNGAVSWSKQIPLSGEQEACDIAAHANGDITVLGSHSTGVFAPNEIIMIRMDASGNILWSKVIGSTETDNMNKIEILSGDRIRLSGGVAVNGILGPATLIFDGSGNLLSEKYLNTISFASPNFVAHAMSDGNLLMTGTDRLGHICDSTGFFLSNFPGQMAGESASACSAPNGNYVVAYSDNIGAPSGGSIVVGSLVPGAFNPQWLNKYNSNLSEQAEGIFTVQDQFMLISIINASNGTASLGISMIDTLGTLLSTKRVTITGYDYITVNNIRQNGDGSILLCAMVQNSTFIPAGLLMKISSDGDPGCNPATYNFSTIQTSSVPAAGIFNQGLNLMTLDSTFTASSVDTSFQVSVPCVVVSDRTRSMKTPSEVFPNPGEGIFTIPGLSSGTLPEVWDMHGKKMEVILMGGGNIELRQREAGIYLLRYSDNKGKLHTQKLVLQ